MTFDRRTFFHRAAAGVAGLGVGTRTPSASFAAEPGSDAAGLPDFNEQDPENYWSAIRDRFPLTRKLAYFNTGGLGPAPIPVLAKAAEVTRQLQEKSEHGHAMFEPARAVVARFLDAAPEEIAFVRNATEGNAIVAAGVKLAAGDEVIFETHAHPGGAFPWLHQEKLRGIRVKLFEPDPRDAANNVTRIIALMTPRTRVVQVSHITAPTGIMLPVADIARVCRERGVWCHLDAAQSVGMIPVSVRALGCDSLATSGHKWLGAPHETGVLWVRRARLDEVAPTLVGAYSGDVEFLPGEFKLATTAMRYEYGTRNAAAMVALAEAVKFQERIGRERIAARGRALTERLRAGLARISDLEILTPKPAQSCAAMLTFRVKKVPFDQLFSRLLKDYAMRCRPVSEQKLNALRVSMHVFNTPAECDALVEAVRNIVRSV